MSMITISEQSTRLRQWVKARNSPSAGRLYRIAKAVRSFSVPVIPLVHKSLYFLHRSIVITSANFKRIVWYTPLFQTRLEAPARRLHVYGGIPLLLGNLKIRIGDDCRVSGKINLTGRTSSKQTPLLTIGNNCDLGWHARVDRQ
jgi:hypothetical protein